MLNQRALTSPPAGRQEDSLNECIGFNRALQEMLAKSVLIGSSRNASSAIHAATGYCGFFGGEGRESNPTRD
jgi:hypothetical protein